MDIISDVVILVSVLISVSVLVDTLLDLHHIKKWFLQVHIKYVSVINIYSM